MINEILTTSTKLDHNEWLINMANLLILYVEYLSSL
jgi:hypothetical protein